MARTPGTARLSGTIEPLAGGALDARDVVQTKADLTASGSFPYPYIGMETYVVAENKKYRLVGEDPTVLANWQEVGSGGGGSVTVDTELSTTSENPVQNKVITTELNKAFKTDDTTFTDLADDDSVPVYDSSANTKKRTLWSNIKSVLKTYFDTLYKLTAGDGIVIEDGEISTDNMASADMAEVVTPLPSVMSRLPRYTTEEQIIGYWIDGKPVYQKVIMVPASITGNYQTTISSSLDMLIKCDVFSKDVNNNIGFIPTGNPNASYNTMVYVSSSGDIVFTIGNSVTFHDTIIIAQYTKTTD